MSDNMPQIGRQPNIGVLIDIPSFMQAYSANWQAA